MDPEPSADEAGEARSRSRRNRAVKESLRDLSGQLARLNHSVGSRLRLSDTELECLDLISRHGPLSPSALARLAALHPATTTGVLDRLERGGWIERDRDPGDRRGVVIRVARGRGAEVLRLYLVDSGMDGAVDEICAQYEPEALDLIVSFLRRTAEAGRIAARRLSGGTSSADDRT
ncbi:MAG TPA: MarR family transcriptional regulator [Streptosporangiaceae bacterium]|jgi:DNA-binding MarR family transcriptional regulator